VQLKKLKKTYFIERIRKMALPKTVFVDGKIIDFDELEVTLVELVREERLERERAVTCLPANQVAMRSITMPSGLSDGEVEAEITAQVRRTLPDQGEVLQVDFQRMNVAGALDMSVFFAATRSDHVDRYVTCLRRAGLSLAIMDVDVFVLLRAVRYALKHTLAECERIAALYIGRGYAVFTAAKGDAVIFHQQWDGSGHAVASMSVLEWLEWCCHTYQLMDIESVAVAGLDEDVEQSVRVIGKHWRSKIYEVNPFSQMAGLDRFGVQFSSGKSADFLLACGLAMRESPSWLS
tara:strand:- start:909 stop:1784 length:876 start_codon:yes stop_codon:yes gene_type:complete